MRLALSIAAGAAMALMLAWEHFNGGVVAHHFLARSDLPAISNWWGLLLIPLLTWFCVGRMARRRWQGDPGKTRALVAGFLSALLFGALLATFFATGRQEWCGQMVMAIPVLALFVPVYRAESVLGFVFGMTFVFGPVLPLMAAAVFSMLGYIIHSSVRFAIRKVRA